MRRWFGAAIPIAGIAGDQQAATFGQACFDVGDAKNTYGTGCFLLMNIGDKPVASKHNLLTTVGWTIAGKTTYCLEGSVFIAGAVVQWLRDGLGIIRRSSDVEALAATVPDNGGVYFVPAFTGLGAPYWDPHARGAMYGLTRGTTAGHLARAALESMAFQTLDLVDGHAARRRSAAQAVEGRRRRVGERLPDAVPSRSAQRAAGAARDDRDDGPRGRVSRRLGRRLLGRPGRRPQPMAGPEAIYAGHR